MLPNQRLLLNPIRRIFPLLPILLITRLARLREEPLFILDLDWLGIVSVGYVGLELELMVLDGDWLDLDYEVVGLIGGVGEGLRGYWLG